MKGSGFVGFLFGLAVGGTAAYFITKDYVTKKEQKIAEDKIKSMKEYVDELRARDEAGELAKNLQYVKPDDVSGPGVGSGYSGSGSDASKSSGYSASYSTPGKVITKRDENGNRVVVGSDKVNVEAIDYTQFYRKPYDPSAGKTEKVRYEAASAVDPAEKEHPEEDYNDVRSKKVRPRLISEEEFDDPAYNHHDKVELCWYTEDEVLSFVEDGQEVYDPEELLGDALEKSGITDPYSEVDTIYVRDPGNGVDYKVERIEYAYKEP